VAMFFPHVQPPAQRTAPHAVPTGTLEVTLVSKSRGGLHPGSLQSVSYTRWQRCGFLL